MAATLIDQGQATGGSTTVLVAVGVLLVLVGAGITVRPGVFWAVAGADRRPLVMALAAVRIVGLIVAFVGLLLVILGLIG